MAQDFDLQIKVSSNVETAVKGFESLGDAVKDVSKDFKAASVSSEAASKGIESVDKAIDDISAPLTTGSQKLNDVADALDRIEKATKKFGREFTQNVTAPIAALAALSLKNIFDTAVDGKGTKSMNDFAAAVQNLKKEFDLFLKDIGEQIAPTMTNFLNIVSGLLNEFRKLSPETKEFLIIFAAIAAAIGPAALALSGFLSVSSQLFLVASKIVLFAPKFLSFFLSPITAVAALSAAIASLVNLMLNLNKAGASVGESIVLSLDLASNYINSKFWPLISSTLDRIQNFIDSSVSGQMSGIGALAGRASDQIKSYSAFYVQEFDKIKSNIDAKLAPIGESVASSLTFGLSEGLKGSMDDLESFFEQYNNKINKLTTKADEEALKKADEDAKKKAQAIAQSAHQIKLSFTGGITDALLDFAQGTKTAEEAFNNFASNFLRQISQMIINAQLFRILSGFSGFNESAASFGSMGQIPTNFADGGLVRGAGTGTSDSINAKLSNGEFVMTAASVKKYGAGFFDRINSLTSTGNSFSKKAGHFADGGLASAAGAPQVVIENTGTDKQVSRTEFDPETAITTIFMEDLSKNGPMSKSIQSNFSLKRGGFK